MPISTLDAIKFGVLVMYAEEMYVDGQKLPRDEPRIKQAGWEVVAYLTARDSVLPTRPSPAGNQGITLQMGGVVFYGYLARNLADPSVFVAAVRGTAGLAEWIIDAEFMPIDYPKEKGAKVEQGFWGIYDSMNLVRLDGTTIIGKAAEAIAATVGAGHVTVAGHSLGSALATYLSLETAQHIPAGTSSVLFASPRTGNKAFAALYHRTLQDRYALFNYVLDVVPYVPFDAPPLGTEYAPLPNETVIEPTTSQADVRLDIGCNHHVICYCAMLDYAFTQTTPKTQEDQKLYACVIGPREFSINEMKAEALALIAKAVSRQNLVKELASKLGRATG